MLKWNVLIRAFVDHRLTESTILQIVFHSTHFSSVSNADYYPVNLTLLPQFRPGLGMNKPESFSVHIIIWSLGFSGGTMVMSLPHLQTLK